MYWNTVSPLLKTILTDLMAEKTFAPFRLVGGTALSLQYGHRMSVDIDLFSDVEYGTLDFELFKNYFAENYSYFEFSSHDKIGMGTFFKIGLSKEENIKVDMYYTDKFVFDEIKEENVRMAASQEIIAMKLDVINRDGRKKDFWDLHFFLDHFSLDEMILFYEKRYPFHDSSTIKTQLLNFEKANDDFNPNCLLGKDWEFIKLDFYEKFG